MSKKKKRKQEKALKKAKKASIEQKIEVIPAEDPQIMKIRGLSNQLQSISTYRDVAHCFSLMDQLKQESAPMLASKGFDQFVQEDKAFGMFGVTDLFGYRPQGTQFWNLFPNPFGIFGYLAENHWAVKVCRDEYIKEVVSDGYFLTGNKSAFKEVQKKLDAFDMKNFRAVLVDYLKIFGNFWLWPQKNLLGGLKDLRILLPHYIRPLLTPDGQKIIGWEYQLGFATVDFRKDEILHQVYRPSMRHYDIGNPCLGALLVDLEADIQASMYNNLVFQKGGLLGLAVLMEAPKSQSVPGTNTMQLAKQIEAELRSNHSGARGGFETIVLSGAKSVEKLHDLADLDGAFHKTSDKVAKQVAHVMGVPHERLGIVTNANQQYHAARLEDNNALQFDKSIKEVVDIVDSFINRVLLPMMGIRGVQIKAKQRYNALTRTATQSGVDLGSLLGVLTVDEYRVEFLKLPPLGGDAGRKPLQLSPRATASLETLPAQPNLPIPSGEADPTVTDDQ